MYRHRPVMYGCRLAILSIVHCYNTRYSTGLKLTVKQVSDKCENKSKQVGELQKNLEYLQLSLSSLEVAKQVGDE